MPEGRPSLKLLTIFGLFLIGSLIGALATALVLMFSSESMSSIVESLQNQSFKGDPNILRVMLLIQHVSTFILPAIIFGVIFYKRKWFNGFDLDFVPHFGILIMGCLFMLVSLPIVNLSFLLNEAIPLPAWAHMFESQAEETISSVLQMDSFGMFVINLFLVAVVPAIGEELVFRGVIQKYAGQFFNRPVLGIWIAAFLFSAMHLQFEGFLPRMALGALMGYLYYWSKALWVPIIAHFMNNGVQVSTLYFSELDLSASDQSATPEMTWWMILISIGLMYLIYRFIVNQTLKEEHVKLQS